MIRWVPLGSGTQGTGINCYIVLTTCQGGGGGATQENWDWVSAWHCDKFNVEGDSELLYMENGGGLCDKLRGVRCTQQINGGGGLVTQYNLTSWAYMEKGGGAGQRTSESGMEVLIHRVLKVIEISAGLATKCL